MSEADPIALLFGGMAKLGPGSDAETRREEIEAFEASEGSYGYVFFALAARP